MTTCLLTTAGMAYYAIRRRQIQVQQEWMVRSYVVTFAFVTCRFLYDAFSYLGKDQARSLDFV